MSDTLTPSDFIEVAQVVGCDPETLMAIATVESRGAGFDSQGRVKILFERHWFRRFTNGKFDSNPSLSNRTPGGYTSNEYARFSQAFALNPEAAMKACSWGQFQIMGFNHALCGFDTVNAFVDAMKVSARSQLDILVRFIMNPRNKALKDAIVAKNWKMIAQYYNGKNYAINRYDIKLASAEVTARRIVQEEYKRLQTYLAGQGKYTGKIDGMIGPMTRQAIAAMSLPSELSWAKSIA